MSEQGICMNCKVIADRIILREILHKDGSHYEWCPTCIAEHQFELEDD